MSLKISPEDEISRSLDVQMIVENPIYKDAWNQIREGVIAAMNQSAMGDEKTHNKLVIALQVVNKLQGIFDTTMQTGKMAEMQLEEKKRWFK
jgi:hypothetical protein